MSTAHLTIDLDAIAANWRALDRASASGVQTAAVLKADAYGLGARRVAQALARAGARRVFVGSIYVLFAMMIWVGCMGGCSYVNVIVKIQRAENLMRTEKELAIMILMMFNDFGILLASVFALILNLTVFKSAA